jgi:hypothetical protein
MFAFHLAFDPCTTSIAVLTLTPTLLSLVAFAQRRCLLHAHLLGELDVLLNIRLRDRRPVDRYTRFKVAQVEKRLQQLLRRDVRPCLLLRGWVAR